MTVLWMKGESTKKIRLNNGNTGNSIIWTHWYTHKMINISGSSTENFYLVCEW